MYELEYVKKRKRRKIIGISGSICAIIVSILSIVAFLGRFVGTFTVALQNANVSLTLSRKSNFENSTSFLRIDKVPSFKEFTYGEFSGIWAFDVIDSEETDLDIGASSFKNDGSIDTLNFFKYTFFLRNNGKEPAAFDFSINILESKAADDGRKIDDTLRVMLFANDDEGSHEGDVYAKRSSRPTHYVNGEANYDSPISVSEYDSSMAHPFVGYATQFKTDTIITSMTEPYFDIGETRRYTIVMWLEGFASDDQKPAPKGASIKIGVEINAYEVK